MCSAKPVTFTEPSVEEAEMGLGTKLVQSTV